MSPRTRTRAPEARLVEPDASAPRALLPAAVLLAAALFLGHVALFSGFVIDDAFITLRYARHIAEGLGPVFNPGQYVEGFSNPLFTFLLAGVWRLLPDAEAFPQAARALGVLSGLGCLILLARLPARGGSWSTALALLLCATSTSFALWSVGGLETSLYAVLILAGLVITRTGSRTAGTQVVTGLLLAAVALSRPEGVLCAAGLFLARLADPGTRRDARGHLLVGVVTVLPVLAWIAYRRATFGDWLPNTYYAKSMPPDLAHTLGLRYLASYVRTNGGPLLYLPALLALAVPRRAPAAVGAFLVLALYLPSIVVVGGDWMNAHRFVAPVVPLLSLVVAEGWIVLLDAIRRGLVARGWTPPARAVLPAGALAVWLLLLVPSVGLTRQERANHYVNASPYYETLGRVVAAVADPGWSVAVHDIGAIGWYGGTRILDLLGLVDADLSHRRTWADAQVGARRPEIVILHYDDRSPALSRWRGLRIVAFDSAYVVPRGAPGLPGSFRVRVDLAPTVDARLARLPAGLESSVARLDGYLRTRQPDGRPVTVFPDPR